MPKAIISNRIYLDCPPEGYDNIKKALTYKIEVKGAGKGGKHTVVEYIRNYKMLPRNIISIPQGRQDLIPPGYEIVDKRIYNEMPFPLPKFPLREGQQAVFDETDESCFINALVGWGKTFTALHIARKLAQKTLIITHTAMLRDQWVEEIKALFDITPGIIGSGVFDIDNIIVVGNIQTVTKHALALCKEFGTVIMDEAHHCPATTFTNLIDNMYSRYRIALSGTMIRTDGKHVVFNDYFGPIIHRPPQSHTLNPSVRLVRPGISLTPNQPWVKKINNLLYDYDYQQYIATIAAHQMGLGHSVLIVASRIEFLTNIKELIGEKCVLVVGSTDNRQEVKEKVESGEVTCIAGSRQIFSEGVSMDRLSCVILAEPIANASNLEQIIGRVMRKHPLKPDPLVIDIQFSGYADKKQNNVRLGFYLEKGWETQSI